MSFGYWESWTQAPERPTLNPDASAPWLGGFRWSLSGKWHWTVPCMLVGPLSMRPCHKEKTREFRSSILHPAVPSPVGEFFGVLNCDILTNCSVPIFLMQLESSLLLSLCFAKGNTGISFCSFSFNLDSHNARICSLKMQERELGQTCAFKACQADPDGAMSGLRRWASKFFVSLSIGLLSSTVPSK